MDRQSDLVQDAGSLHQFAAPEWKPRVYQARGVEWLLNTEGGLCLPPGLGKSSIALAAFVELRRMKLAKRMLLVAPLKVCQITWPDEVRKWRQFQHLKVGLAHGPNKAQVLADPQYDIVLLNYDGIVWAMEQLRAKHDFDVLLCDELSLLKNIQSQRFKALKPMLETFKFRWGLTGTPASNGLMDLFGQVYTLDRGKRLGKYITHFRAKYFHQKPWDRYKYYISEAKAAELSETVPDLLMSVKPEEWLDLPPFVVVTRDVYLDTQLHAKFWKWYKDLEFQMITHCQDQTITATSAGVLTQKLRQLTSGAIYDENRNVIKFHDAKLDALSELVDELLGEPLIVAYSTDHERQRILERFPDAITLKGGMSQAETEYAVSAWNSGQASMLLMQHQTSMGLNLQFGGNVICWFSLTYNLQDFIQLNKRLHRSGQTKPVFCYLLSIKGSIDEEVAQILADKNVTQEQLLERLKCKILQQADT